jgi:hypothetical protein
MDGLEPERRRQTEHDCALEELARRFMVVTPEDNKIVLEPVGGRWSVSGGRHMLAAIYN